MLHSLKKGLSRYFITILNLHSFIISTERVTEIEQNNCVREKHLRKVVIGFWRKKNAGDDKVKKRGMILNLLAESDQVMFGDLFELSIKIRFFSISVITFIYKKNS